MLCLEAFPGPAEMSLQLVKAGFTRIVCRSHIPRCYPEDSTDYVLGLQKQLHLILTKTDILTMTDRAFFSVKSYMWKEFQSQAVLQYIAHEQLLTHNYQNGQFTYLKWHNYVFLILYMLHGWNKQDMYWGKHYKYYHWTENA